MARGLLGAALTLGVLAAPASAGAAGAPAVETLVVGRDGNLRELEVIRAASTTVSAGGRRCAVGAATPLAALLATAPGGVRVRDYGSCKRTRPRDSASLFVYGVAGDRNRGRDGWVYKVGRRAGSGGAADLAGPFGHGLLRTGDRVVWFWCRSRASGCQRSLEAKPERAVVAPGAAVRVTVRGYDDAGHGRVIAGAAVQLGSALATTGADGVATFTAPAAPGAYVLAAERSGLVRSFPGKVTVR